MSSTCHVRKNKGQFACSKPRWRLIPPAGAENPTCKANLFWEIFCQNTRNKSVAPRNQVRKQRLSLSQSPESDFPYSSCRGSTSTTSAALAMIGKPTEAHPAKATMYICKRPPRPVKGLKIFEHIEHIVFKWIDSFYVFHSWILFRWSEQRELSVNSAWTVGLLASASRAIWRKRFPTRTSRYRSASALCVSELHLWALGVDPEALACARAAWRQQSTSYHDFFAKFTKWLDIVWFVWTPDMYGHFKDLLPSHLPDPVSSLGGQPPLPSQLCRLLLPGHWTLESLEPLDTSCHANMHLGKTEDDSKFDCIHPRLAETNRRVLCPSWSSPSRRPCSNRLCCAKCVYECRMLLTNRWVWDGVKFQTPRSIGQSRFMIALDQTSLRQLWFTS